MELGEEQYFLYLHFYIFYIKFFLYSKYVLYIWDKHNKCYEIIFPDRTKVILYILFLAMSQLLLALFSYSLDTLLMVNGNDIS